MTTDQLFLIDSKNFDCTCFRRNDSKLHFRIQVFSPAWFQATINRNSKFSPTTPEITKEFAWNLCIKSNIHWLKFYLYLSAECLFKWNNVLLFNFRRISHKSNSIRIFLHCKLLFAGILYRTMNKDKNI